MASVVSLEQACAQCRELKSIDEFIGRRGRPVTYCAACRTKYYGGAEHVAGEANVGSALRDGSSRKRMGLGARSKTENVTRLSKRELEAGRVHLLILDELGGAHERPTTRGDCIGGQRPCPWVTCRFNLFLDIDEEIGSIKYNFPDVEPEDVAPEKSCALDIADEGGATLEDVARTMNVTRERIRQVESKALDRVRRKSTHRAATDAKLLREFSDAPEGASFGARSDGQGSVFKPKAERVEPDDVVEDEPPTRISFFADPDSERVDELVTSAVWNMFARWQNGRGFDCRSNQSKAQSKSMAARRGAEPAPPTHEEEETTMATTKRDGLTEREAVVLKTYEDLLAKLGRVPANPEIADVIGGWATANTVRAARGVLVDRGLAEHRPRGGGPLDGTTAATPKASRAAIVVRKSAPPPKKRVTPAPAAPPRAASRDPLVADLITKRDELRRKADALDVAIEALSVAL